MLLLGIAGVAGLAAIADQTLLSKASAGIADLGGMVEQVKKAQTIAASFDSGDPNALQGLLEALVDDQGVEPGEASDGLFGLLASSTGLMSAGGAGPEYENARSESVQPQRGHRVTMIMKSASGGLALVDGKPIRAGETRDGITLIEVNDDDIVVRESGENTTLSLR